MTTSIPLNFKNIGQSSLSFLHETPPPYKSLLIPDLPSSSSSYRSLCPPNLSGRPAGPPSLHRVHSLPPLLLQQPPSHPPVHPRAPCRQYNSFRAGGGVVSSLALSHPRLLIELCRTTSRFSTYAIPVNDHHSGLWPRDEEQRRRKHLSSFSSCSLNVTSD